jgi:hypothetical protein
MGEIQAAQLIVFVVAMIGLLLALEVGLRRVGERNAQRSRASTANVDVVGLTTDGPS